MTLPALLFLCFLSINDDNIVGRWKLVWKYFINCLSRWDRSRSSALVWLLPSIFSTLPIYPNEVTLLKKKVFDSSVDAVASTMIQKGIQNVNLNHLLEAKAFASWSKYWSKSAVQPISASKQRVLHEKANGVLWLRHSWFLFVCMPKISLEVSESRSEFLPSST